MNGRVIRLKNEQYRAKINALVLVKKQMHPMNRMLVEDMKYRLDINNPLQAYDFIWIDDVYRIFYG